jgi:hypothetical protein
MPIDALIFDLDNTLWDVGPVIVRAEQMLADFLAEAYPRVLERHTLASMRELRSRLMLEEPAMLHDFTWLRLEMLRRLAREADYPESMAQQAFEVFYRARNEVVLYDDVLPALTTCGRAGGCSRSATAMRIWPRSGSRSSSSAASRRATPDASNPTRGSSAGSSTKRDSRPRGSCTWATIRTQTSRGREVPVCGRCGSTAAARRGRRRPSPPNFTSARWRSSTRC